MNFVLLTVDALRPDHLGCYGYDKPTSPNIDEFAEESVVFENAVSTAPMTKVAFKPIFTGQYAKEFSEILGIPEDGEETLAEVFSSEGLKTGGFHSNGFLSSELNFDRGFDTFYDSGVWSGDSKSQLANIKDKVRERINDGTHLHSVLQKAYDIFMTSNITQDEGSRTYRTIEEVHDIVFDWIDKQENEFFLWIHYMDVHAPYIYRDEYISEVSDRNISDKEFRRARTPTQVISRKESPDQKEIDNAFALYDSEIRYLDEHLGNLFKKLDENGPNTIVFSADHGESFGELRGKFHGESAHWNSVDVPLLINTPDVEPAKIEYPVSSINIPNTILDLAGVEAPEHLQGPNLLSEPDQCDPVIIETHAQDGELAIGVVQDGWKYIYELADESELLFNLEADPKEKENIVAEYGELASEFHAIVQEYLGDYAGGLGEASFDDLSDSTRNNLEELGYID